MNIDQMPNWIWLFWLPQLLHLLYSSLNSLEFRLAISVLEKMSKLYPQSLQHPLKMKEQQMKMQEQ
jgi:hypothetical protein